MLPNVKAIFCAALNEKQEEGSKQFTYAKCTLAVPGAAHGGAGLGTGGRQCVASVFSCKQEKGREGKGRERRSSSPVATVREEPTALPTHHGGSLSTSQPSPLPAAHWQALKKVLFSCQIPAARFAKG